MPTGSIRCLLAFILLHGASSQLTLMPQLCHLLQLQAATGTDSRLYEVIARHRENQQTFQLSTRSGRSFQVAFKDGVLVNIEARSHGAAIYRHLAIDSLIGLPKKGWLAFGRLRSNPRAYCALASTARSADLRFCCHRLASLRHMTVPFQPDASLCRLWPSAWKDQVIESIFVATDRQDEPIAFVQTAETSTSERRSLLVHNFSFATGFTEPVANLSELPPFSSVFNLNGRIFALDRHTNDLWQLELSSNRSASSRYNLKGTQFSQQTVSTLFGCGRDSLGNRNKTRVRRFDLFSWFNGDKKTTEPTTLSTRNASTTKATTYQTFPTRPPPVIPWYSSWMLNLVIALLIIFILVLATMMIVTTVKFQIKDRKVNWARPPRTFERLSRRSNGTDDKSADSKLAAKLGELQPWNESEPSSGVSSDCKEMNTGSTSNGSSQKENLTKMALDAPSSTNSSNLLSEVDTEQRVESVSAITQESK